MAASDPTPYVATPTGTLQGVAAFSWDGSAWQPSGRAGPDVATPTGVLQGVAPFSWSGSAWTPAGRAQPGVATPSGVLDGVAVYTWSGSAWTPASGTATPSTPSGALRGVAAFSWDGAAWQPAAQARASVPTPYGVLDGVAMFNWSGTAWAPGAAVPSGATLDLSFLGGTLDPSLTFTRGSTATYFDSSGVMQTVSGNTPRFDYDPVTHAALGLLIEETRTNGVRNGNATGAVPGTPGTMPTNWAVLNSAAGSMAFNVIGTGTESGIPYVDIRLVGTPANNAIRFGMETANGIAAAVGQTWTNSVYVRVVGGSLANVAGVVFEIQVADGTQAINVNTTGVLSATLTPTVAGLSSQRASVIWTIAVSSGTVAAIRNSFFVPCTTAGVPMDLTLRVGGVQLEQGAFPTSYIPTTAAAVTRSADALTIAAANMSPWFNVNTGSWQMEAVQLNTVGAARRLINNAAGAAVYPMYETNVANLACNDGAGLGSSGAITSGVVFKGGSTWGTGVGGTLSVNGAAVTANAAMVTGFSSLLTNGVRFFGDAPAGANASTGYIRRVRYWPRVLTNAELQQVTT